jgi:hypothetical protein
VWLADSTTCNLAQAAVEQIVDAVAQFDYDRLYRRFAETVIEREGQAAVDRSTERYQRAIRGVLR